MKSEREHMDIISAYRELGSYRGAAELCGDEAGGERPERAERSHNYDAVVKLVAERVRKSGGRISAKRLLPRAQAAGYEGSARNFRRLVAEQKALWRKDHRRGRPASCSATATCCSKALYVPW